MIWIGEDFAINQKDNINLDLHINNNIGGQNRDNATYLVQRGQDIHKISQQMRNNVRMPWYNNIDENNNIVYGLNVLCV